MNVSDNFSKFIQFGLNISANTYQGIDPFVLSVLLTPLAPPGGTSIVKISWFLYLFLIFLSVGAPNNFFSNYSKQCLKSPLLVSGLRKMIYCPI
jgi:hypothetical protein